MRGMGCVGAVLLMTMASPVAAQTPARFQWRAGQALNYRVTETISKREVVDGQRSEATTKLRHLKQWKVLEVDAAGVATLEMSMRAFRLEQPAPSGDVLVFDSEHPEQSDPQLREQLSKYVATPLAVVRVDGRGQLLEVRESKNGPANRFVSQLPFVLTLPAQGLAAGQTWERTYQVTLDPPAGLGEKYDAVQKYACKAVQDGLARVSVSTGLKTPPEAGAQVPLVLMQPEGELVFDLKSGRLKQALLRVDRELKNHQGEGSSLRLLRTYREEYAGGN